MNNKELLHAVLEADAAAQTRLRSAQKRQKQLAVGGAAQEKTASEYAMREAERRASEKRADAEASAQLQIQELDRELSRRRTAMNIQFAAIRDDCIERIFRETVGLV